MSIRRSSGWIGEPPTWEGRKPDLICTVCGFRYWTFYTLKKNKKCPVKHYIEGSLERCPGRMRKLAIDE